MNDITQNMVTYSLYFLTLYMVCKLMKVIKLLWLVILSKNYKRNVLWLCKNEILSKNFRSYFFNKSFWNNELDQILSQNQNIRGGIYQEFC